MNLQGLFESLHRQLHEVQARLDGYSTVRPWRNPHNTTAYDLWYQNQTLEVREAEQQLYQKGYYKYEGEQFMFHVKDKTDKVIHVDDVVSTDSCPEGVVMSIISEKEVQINPVGKGLPFVVPPGEVTVTYSFIEKLLTLKSDEELQAILRRAEGLAEERNTPHKTTTSSPSAKPSKPKQEELSSW